MKIPTITFAPNYLLFTGLLFIPSTLLQHNYLAQGTAHPFNEGRFVLYAKVPEHDISPFGTHSQGVGVRWVPCQGRGPSVKGGSLMEYPVRSQRVHKGLLETLTQKEKN